MQSDYQTSCRHFSGYKPCDKSATCDSQCPHLSVPSVRVLLVHLEALGAVLRSTALLPAIRRRFPGCHITWVTQKPADQLLTHNPYVDRVLTTTPDDLLQLNSLEFDVALVIDKSLKAAGVLKQTRADVLFGFQVEASSGAILPATPAARELWEIGLSNHKKFFENKKTEVQLAHEALELGPWLRDEYSLTLTSSEEHLAQRRRAAWSRREQVIVGLNTGCAKTIPYKKLPISSHRDLAIKLASDPRFRVVLLGGKEDSVRNQRIGHGLDVVQSPTDHGLRDGAASVAACDIVVTGDSLGMHMAIALKKWTVAWFGPTCDHEIEFYDRGMAIKTKASCSPCWKRNCDKAIKCDELVSIDAIIEGVHRGAELLCRGNNWQSAQHPRIQMNIS